MKLSTGNLAGENRCTGFRGEAMTNTKEKMKMSSYTPEKIKEMETLLMEAQLMDPEDGIEEVTGGDYYPIFLIRSEDSIILPMKELLS
ncbi:MAG: hypothetical protein PUB10_01975 [Clostridiales bacterium]|nr:hypothetical protein [Clostridiales bacterium]